MIVWSGGTASTLTQSGGVYDPFSDSWSVTSTGSNIPSARSYHLGIWTGSKMIVWGGNGNGYLNSGGVYVP